MFRKLHLVLFQEPKPLMWERVKYDQRFRQVQLVIIYTNIDKCQVHSSASWISPKWYTWWWTTSSTRGWRKATCGKWTFYEIFWKFCEYFDAEHWTLKVCGAVPDGCGSGEDKAVEHNYRLSRNSQSVCLSQHNTNSQSFCLSQHNTNSQSVCLS